MNERNLPHKKKLKHPKAFITQASNQKWTTYKEVLIGPNATNQKFELHSIYKNKTSILTMLLKIDKLWVVSGFSNSNSYDGSFERYKICLITQGFTQVKGGDYNDIFSPIVKLYFIFVIIVLVVQLDLIVSTSIGC